jgi:cob(I)alamin adenosyltransferase
MSSKCALYWDESYLWGIMLHDALIKQGIAVTLLRSTDIASGALMKVDVLFVPGGWASNKKKSLGSVGIEAIKNFVSDGGTYIGICGGAGFATTDGLGLLDISRKPLSERVPGLAGRVKVKLSDSELFADVQSNEFQLWWPSQFVINDPSIKVLASFDSATEACFSSDVCVGDVHDWQSLEQSYGINLDPAKMQGDPLFVQGTYGKGKVYASLLHFDAPECPNSPGVLDVLCRDLERSYAGTPIAEQKASGKPLEIMRDLHEFGERNFLWFKRGELIQWRRGIRGLEYYTLYRMVSALDKLGAELEVSTELELTTELKEFADDAKALLGRENLALKRGESITFRDTSEQEIKNLRAGLFSESKSYGGRFKALLDKVDSALFDALNRPSEVLEPGLVHLYTGQGKGKTTAAVGLALRAGSRGLRVLFAQFMKRTEGGEPMALQNAGIDVLRFENVKSPFFNPDADLNDIALEGRAALKKLSAIMMRYDLVVIDEFVRLFRADLLDVQEAVKFIESRPGHVVLALTGRGAQQEIIDAADLVSNIEAVKHPYDAGIGARLGIEF